MSITFTPEIGPIDHYVVECLNCGATQDFSDGDAAFDITRFSDIGAAVLDTCTNTGTFKCGDAAVSHAVEALGMLPSVNMANGNAEDVIDVLDVLGIDRSDISGSMPARDFLGRILMALAVAPDSAPIPAHLMHGSTNVIRCERTPGYVQDRLRDLHEVAEFAITHNRPITWA